MPLITLLASAVEAGPISFTTGGMTYTASQLIETPGSVLAVGAQADIAAAAAQVAMNGGGSATTPDFTVLYQARVQLADNTGTAVGYPGQFTAVAEFQENATVSAANPNSATFNIDTASAQPNFFQIYYNPTITSSNFNGTGFTDGTLVYQGSFTAETTASLTSNPAEVVNYDQNIDKEAGAAAYYNGKQSITGSGNSVLTVGETYYNPTFFTNNFLAQTTLTLTLATNIPFLSTDPAKAFFNGTTPNLPTVVGAGTTGDFEFETSAHSTFAPFVSVPEPASIAMTLIGFGGTGLGLLVARRRAKARPYPVS